MFQLARNNLKLSNQLGGTGFAVDTEVLKKLGWGATCLTEDLEFTCKLVLNGYKVGWAHDAKIYDEKPLTLKASWNQRRRWMQGFADVYSRYFFKLLKKGIKEFNFVAIDCALYCIQPIMLILFSIAALITYAANIQNTFDIITHLSKYIAMFRLDLISLTIIIAFALQYIYTPFLLILDKRLNFKIFIYYLLYPLYSLTWLPISIQGIVHKNDKEWNHTKHTRSVDIADIEKAQDTK
jgi:cellulose synthase/poly-beta-1,6-N-acetylglucosamine synthase-like glycosyltransferase